MQQQIFKQKGSCLLNCPGVDNVYLKNTRLYSKQLQRYNGALLLNEMVMEINVKLQVGDYSIKQDFQDSFIEMLIIPDKGCVCVYFYMCGISVCK